MAPLDRRAVDAREPPSISSSARCRFTEIASLCARRPRPQPAPAPDPGVRTNPTGTRQSLVIFRLCGTALRHARLSRAGLGGVEVLASRMVKDEGGDGGLGLHHVLFRQLDADLLRLQQPKELLLQGKIGTGRIPKGVTAPPVAGLKAVAASSSRDRREIPTSRGSCCGAIRRSLGRLDGERLDSVALRYSPRVFIRCVKARSPFRPSPQRGRRCRGLRRPRELT